MEEIDPGRVAVARRRDDNEMFGDNADEEGDMEYMTILTYNPPKSNFDWINREAKMGSSQAKQTYAQIDVPYDAQEVASGPRR